MKEVCLVKSYKEEEYYCFSWLSGILYFCMRWFCREIFPSFYRSPSIFVKSMWINSWRGTHCEETLRTTLLLNLFLAERLCLWTQPSALASPLLSKAGQEPSFTRVRTGERESGDMQTDEQRTRGIVCVRVCVCVYVVVSMHACVRVSVCVCVCVCVFV